MPPPPSQRGLVFSLHSLFYMDKINSRPHACISYLVQGRGAGTHSGTHMHGKACWPSVSGSARTYTDRKHRIWISDLQLINIDVRLDWGRSCTVSTGEVTARVTLQPAVARCQVVIKAKWEYVSSAFWLMTLLMNWCHTFEPNPEFSKVKISLIFDTAVGDRWI